MTLFSPNRIARPGSGRSPARAATSWIFFALLLGLTPATLAGQYTQIGSDHFRERLDSGLEISGRLQVRAGVRGGVFLQMGISDLRWDAYWHDGKRYTYEELRRWYGDEVPPNPITRGYITPEFQASYSGACALYYHARHMISLQLGGAQMGSGVTEDIMGEYTFEIDDMKEPSEDATRRATRCILDNPGISPNVNLLEIHEHYFRHPNLSGSYESRLDDLLDERESRSEARRGARRSDRSVGSRGSSGAGAGRRTDRNDRERERRDEARRDEEKSAHERNLDYQVQRMAQQREWIRRAQAHERAGDYQAAKQAYVQAYRWLPSPELEAKIQSMDVATATSAAASAMAAAATYEIDEPDLLLDDAGYIQLGYGSFAWEDADDISQDYTSINAGMGFLWNWPVSPSWAFSAEVDGNVNGGLTWGCSDHQSFYDDCDEGRLNSLDQVDIQAFVGGTWKGYVGGGYGFMGQRSWHDYGVADGTIGETLSGETTIQEAGYLWVGTKQKRGGMMARLSVYSTGELLTGDRTIEEPYLSRVVYRAEVGLNLMYLRYSRYTQESLDPALGVPPLETSGWRVTAGYRFVK